MTGVVVNERPNAARRDYDLLKATLHDAARHGPARANRAALPDFRAHLLGRIAWVEQLNPTRGARLRRPKLRPHRLDDASGHERPDEGPFLVSRAVVGKPLRPAR